MDSVLLPVVIPAAAGLLALLLPGRTVRTALGVAGTLAAFVASATLVDVRHAASFGSLALGPVDFAFAFRIDAFSGWATALVALLAFATANYAAGWWRKRGGAPGAFYAWVLFASAGASGVLLADNLILLVVCWEVVTLCLYLLVVAVREDGGPGAAKAFTMLGLGDAALLVGVLLLGLEKGWSVSALTDVPTDSPTMVVAWLLLFVAAAAKAGAMPLHSWIPTMSTGTNAAVMAFLPGALDKVLGIYLLARISIDWFAPTDALRMVVMAVGAVTILGGVFMAMVQHDLRRLLSFHAVSQVGYMLLGIGTGTLIGVIGGVFHMVNNALYKACLFLGAGSVERETGTMELNRLGGLARTMPLTFLSMFVAALAISGIPPLNGFVSKWLVYQSCVAAGQPIFLIAAIFGSALTLASFVKVLHSVFWGARPSHLDGVQEGEGGIGMPAAMVSLAVLCILFGVFAPAVIDTWIGPAVIDPATGVVGSSALQGGAAAWAAPGGGADQTVAALPKSVFEPLAVTGLLALALLAALGLAYMGNMRARRVRGVFVGGQVFNRDVNRFPGTEFYKTVRELPGLGKALEAGEKGSLDVYDIGGRIGKPIIGLFRRLHSGRVTDYVAWSLLGLVVLMAVLMLGR